jgi:hypothetical protein
LDRLCGSKLGEQLIPKPPSQLNASIHQAICADRGFLGQAAGIGPGQLRDAHAQANEGDLDLRPDQELAGRSAAVRTHQAGKYGPLPGH